MTFRIACAAPNCKMRTYDFSIEQLKLANHNYIVSFHKFPVNEVKRRSWIEAAGFPGWDPPKDGSICSLHFRDDCFNSNQLYDFAVPTIFFSDFRGYLKEIISTMNLDVSLDSDHEDILSKSLKNISPVVSDSEEIVEYDVSIEDDDAEGVSKEVGVVETDNHVTPNTSSIKTNQLSTDNGVTSNKSVSSKPKLKTVDKMKKSSLKPQPKSIPASISETPSSKLLKLLNKDSFTEMSIMQPAKLELVHQLINIVCMANFQNNSPSLNGNSAMGTYVITTKQDTTTSVIQQMETKDIVSMLTKIVESIKNGSFIKPDNISIICSSPTIFLIKNVVVKNFDRSMNSVYVITSENLTEPLRKLSDKMDSSKSANAKEKSISSNLTNTPSPRPAAPICQDVTSASSQECLLKQPDKTPLQKTKIIINKSPKGTTARTLLNSNKNILLTTSSDNKSAPPSQLPTTTAMSTSTKVVSVLNVGAASTTAAKQVLLTRPKLVSSDMTKLISLPMKSRRVIITPPSNTTDKNTMANKTINLPIQSNQAVVTSLLSATSKVSPLIAASTSKSASTVTQSFPSGTSTNTLKPTIAKIASSTPIIVSSNSNKPIVRALASSATPEQSTLPIYTISDSPPSVTKPNAIPDNSFSVLIPRAQLSTKRKGEDVTMPSLKKVQIDNSAYLSDQKKEIKALEASVIKTERDIAATRKKIQTLKKCYLSVKNPLDAKSDEQLVEQILRKYVETDAVQFFICQMKVAGKACTQYRWTEEEKLFSLSLLYKNPLDYHILFQRFTLPSDKTLNKFVAKIKRLEADSKPKR